MTKGVEIHNHQSGNTDFLEYRAVNFGDANLKLTGLMSLFKTFNSIIQSLDFEKGKYWISTRHNKIQMTEYQIFDFEMYPTEEKR